MSDSTLSALPDPARSSRSDNAATCGLEAASAGSDACGATGVATTSAGSFAFAVPITMLPSTVCCTHTWCVSSAKLDALRVLRHIFTGSFQDGSAAIFSARSNCARRAPVKLSRKNALVFWMSSSSCGFFLFTITITRASNSSTFFASNGLRSDFSAARVASCATSSELPALPAWARSLVVAFGVATTGGLSGVAGFSMPAARKSAFSFSCKLCSIETPPSSEEKAACTRSKPRIKTAVKLR